MDPQAEPIIPDPPRSLAPLFAVGSPRRAPPSPLRPPASPRRLKSYNDWAQGFFEKKGTKFYCLLCDEQGVVVGYGPLTSKNNWVKHLRKEHPHVSPPVYLEITKQKKDDDRTTQRTLSDFGLFSTNEFERRRELLVYFFASRHLSVSLFDDYRFKSLFGEKLCGLNRATLRDETFKLSNKITASFCERAAGPCSLTLDGAKDVSANKIVASCVRRGKDNHVYQLYNTENAELDTHWFSNHVELVITELCQRGCPVVAITTDNERSVVAGIRETIRSAYPHLIWVACGPHTVELMLNDFSEAFPELKNAIEGAVAFCRCVRNQKANRKLLYDTQIALGEKNPLVVVVPNNTRKWSGGCLTIARMLRLEVPLRSIISKVPGLPPFDWENLKHFQTFLIEFYKVEQLLQRDDANVIHYAHAFFSLEGVIGTISNSIMAVSPQRALDLCNAFMRHLDKVVECGVIILAHALWPSPKNLSNYHKLNALNEFEKLVKSQWSFYQKFPDYFKLPVEYLGGEPHVFIMKAKAQLNEHFEGGEHFLTSQKGFEESEAQMGRRPLGEQTGSSPTWMVDPDLCVESYWGSVASVCPELRVVVRVMQVIAASEAIVERVFSYEGILHDKLHNRLDPAYTEARVKLWGNYGLEQIVKARAAPLVLESDSEEEEEEEE